MARLRIATAQWRHLVLLSYGIAPALLQPRVPCGCELDLWQGRALVSLVGLRFLEPRVLGLRIPLHREFPQLNFRFYVRRRVASGWRHGVVFLRELGPSRALAALARALGQDYAVLPLRCRIEPAPQSSGARVSYEWQRAGACEQLSAAFTGEPELPEAGTLAHFIAERHWGYAGRAGGSTFELEVQRPPWRLWPARSPALRCDAARLLGPQFAEALSAPPSAAWVAEGSAVALRIGRAADA
jgi:uncharacterized protein YqjF (DUF2071 family)